MSNENRNREWREILPKGRPAIIGALIVAAMAFFLGGLIFGGGDSPSADAVVTDSQQADTTSAAPTMWTCSMHPQIRLPHPGKCPICFMDLIPVSSESSGDELGPTQLRMSKTAMQLARIETSPVVRAFANRQIRMVGKLVYDETRVSYITAWVPGRLDRLYVDYTGARVSKGDHLVDMYSPELVSAQEELLQAKKAVASIGAGGSSVLVSTAGETLKAVREKLRLFGLSDGQIDNIEQSQQPSDNLTIDAPIGGVVVHKDAREGMYVTTGTKIYTIADLRQLWVMFDAYESDLPWLRDGQHVSFTSESFPGETFDAVVSFIDPTVDPTTRTINVRAIVKNKDGRLKPEMFVSGSVSARLNDAGHLVKSTGNESGGTNSDNAPLLIPASAPLITGKRAIVYVELPNDDGPLFEGREVTLGPRAGDYYVVKSGLNEGDMVVTNGAFRIDSELQIQAKPSMMSPDGSKTMVGHQHGSDVTEQSSSATMVQSAESKPSAMPTESMTEAQAALTPLYKAYFNVQMSLAGDDLQGAKKAFADVVEKARSANMELFKGDAHSRWMKISKALISASEKGAAAEDIAAARDAFFYASKAAIELHDDFGHAADAPFYLTFCPMARNGAGAYWLQTVDTVYNSFYGAAMLRCGEIKDKLPSGKAL